jgi:hypothetical protein
MDGSMEEMEQMDEMEPLGDDGGAWRGGVEGGGRTEELENREADDTKDPGEGRKFPRLTIS